MSHPKSSPFQDGDLVRIKDLPEVSGLIGTIVKPVGSGRWAVKLNGQDKSKVIRSDNLEKLATPSPKCSIVGTWDDWETNEMSWDQDSQCYEFNITLGKLGYESFRILLDDDWDRCMYPDRKDASPHDDHVLKGPDDGGCDTEWTIGHHPLDHAARGVSYKVQVFVEASGLPKHVSWKRHEADGSRALRAGPNQHVEDVAAPVVQNATQLVHNDQDNSEKRPHAKLPWHLGSNQNRKATVVTEQMDNSKPCPNIRTKNGAELTFEEWLIEMEKSTSTKHKLVEAPGFEEWLCNVEAERIRKKSIK